MPTVRSKNTVCKLPGMHARAAELIATLGLRPHPEGGYYVEVFRSPMSVRPDDGRAPRAALTTIYFLLTAGDCSRWHRVASDEVWHHLEGAPLDLFVAEPRFSAVTQLALGAAAGHVRPVQVVAAMRWQAAQSTGEYTLASCAVGPGFAFADFAMLDEGSDDAAEMRRLHPDLARFI